MRIRLTEMPQLNASRMPFPQLSFWAVRKICSEILSSSFLSMDPHASNVGSRIRFHFHSLDSYREFDWLVFVLILGSEDPIIYGE